MDEEIELQAPRPFPHLGSFWTTYWSTPEKTKLLASEVTPRADEERCVYCRENDIDVCWQIRGGVVCLECKFAKRRCAECYGRRPHANDPSEWFTSELDYLRIVEQPHKLVQDILDNLPPAERERAKDEFDQFPNHMRRNEDFEVADNSTAAALIASAKAASKLAAAAAKPKPSNGHLPTPSSSSSTPTRPIPPSAVNGKTHPPVRSTTPEGSPPPFDIRELFNGGPAAKRRRVETTEPGSKGPPRYAYRSTTPEGTPPPYPPPGWVPRIQRSTTPPGSPPPHWPASLFTSRRLVYSLPISAKGRNIRSVRFIEKMRDVLEKAISEPGMTAHGLLTAIGRLGIGFGFGYYETFRRGGVLDEWWDSEAENSPHRQMYLQLNPTDNREIGSASRHKRSAAVVADPKPETVGITALATASGSDPYTAIPFTEGGRTTTWYKRANGTASPSSVSAPALSSSAAAHPSTGFARSTTPTAPPNPDTRYITISAPATPLVHSTRPEALTPSVLSIPVAPNFPAVDPAPIVNGSSTPTAVPASTSAKRKRVSSVASSTNPTSPVASSSKPASIPATSAPTVPVVTVKAKPLSSATKATATASKPSPASRKRAAASVAQSPVKSTPLANSTSRSRASVGGSEAIANPLPTTSSRSSTAPSTSAVPPASVSVGFAAPPPKGSMRLGSSTSSALAAAASITTSSTRGTPSSAHKSQRR